MTSMDAYRSGAPPAQGPTNLADILERVLDKGIVIAVDTRQNDLIVDRMVANTAFLVAASERQRFDDAVAQLTTDVAHRIDVKYVGPFPPYSFADVHLPVEAAGWA